jgi:acyl carrier protein
MNDFLQLFADVLERKSDEVCVDDNFRQYEQWDSLALLTVLAMVNEEYDIIIDAMSFKSFQTVGDVYNYIINNN